MESKTNYLLLFLVISCGVAVGNVVSNWIISKYLENEPEIQTPINKDKVMPEVYPKTNEPKKQEQKQINQEQKNEPRETIKLSPDNTDKSDDAASSINSKELIEQRRLDKTGIRLAKQCNEWTVVHKDMQTKTSERGMNKYCDQYYDYISFGALPDSN